MTENWKQITASWKGDLTFQGENEEGGTVMMGPSIGAEGIGPMQLLLTGLAGCTGIDVVSTLKKMRAPLQDIKVTVRGKRAQSYPMVYTDIEVEYLLWGEGLKAKDVEKAIRLSEEKYCSASVMLGKTAQIKSSYKILTPEKSEA